MKERSACLFQSEKPAAANGSEQCHFDITEKRGSEKSLKVWPKCKTQEVQQTVADLMRCAGLRHRFAAEIQLQVFKKFQHLQLRRAEPEQKKITNFMSGFLKYTREQRFLLQLQPNLGEGRGGVTLSSSSLSGTATEEELQQ